MTTSQLRKDACHIIKAAVHLAEYGRVLKAIFRGSVFYLELKAEVNELTDTPLGLAVAILDTMQTMAAKSEGLGTMEAHVVCRVGKDRHDVRTPVKFLEDLLRYSQGKRDLLTANIVEDWVKKSRYRRVRG